MQITADTIRGALEELGLLLIEAARAYLMTTGPYPLKMRNSKLLQSMTTQVQQSRNAKGQFGGFDASGLSVFVQDYAKYVISGRRPFAKKVPIAALVEWIKIKGVGEGNLPRASIRTRNAQGRLVRRRTADGRFIDRNAITALSINKLAWAIQASIYRNGIKGRDFVRVAIDAGEKAFTAWLDTHALDAITKDLDNVFTFSANGRR